MRTGTIGCNRNNWCRPSGCHQVATGTICAGPGPSNRTSKKPQQEEDPDNAPWDNDEEWAWQTKQLRKEKLRKPDADPDEEGVPRPDPPLPERSNALLCPEHRQYLANLARAARIHGFATLRLKNGRLQSPYSMRPTPPGPPRPCEKGRGGADFLFGKLCFSRIRRKQNPKPLP